MFGLGTAKSIVGLDIGSSSIKAVELKKTKGEISVSSLGVEPLASDIVVDSMIVDSGSVSTAISKIFNEHKIKSRSVATSVSGHSVIVKKITMTTMTMRSYRRPSITKRRSIFPSILRTLILTTRFSQRIQVSRRWTYCWWR